MADIAAIEEDATASATFELEMPSAPSVSGKTLEGRTTPPLNGRGTPDSERGTPRWLQEAEKDADLDSPAVGHALQRSSKVETPRGEVEIPQWLQSAETDVLPDARGPTPMSRRRSTDASPVVAPKASRASIDMQLDLGLQGRQGVVLLAIFVAQIVLILLVIGWGGRTPTRTHDLPAAMPSDAINDACTAADSSMAECASFDVTALRTALEQDRLLRSQCEAGFVELQRRLEEQQRLLNDEQLALQARLNVMRERLEHEQAAHAAADKRAAEAAREHRSWTHLLSFALGGAAAVCSFTLPRKLQLAKVEHHA
jgi:hypothetical protein